MNVKRILILGAGRSSIVLINYLESYADQYGWDITVVDKTTDHVKKLVKSSSRVIKLDIFNDDELSNLFVNSFYQEVKGLHYIHLRDIFNRLDSKNLINKIDEYFLRTHVSYIPIFHTMVRVSIETAFPTMDNTFFDIILRIPPELRFNHRIHRKFLMKLSPELSEIPYNKTMVRADAPLAFWKFGAFLQRRKEQLKRMKGEERNRLLKAIDALEKEIKRMDRYVRVLSKIKLP